MGVALAVVTASWLLAVPQAAEPAAPTQPAARPTSAAPEPPAAPAPAPATPPQLAAVGLTGLHVPQDQLTYYGDHLAQRLRLRGVKVVTQSEIRALIGVERQKELMGCADDSSNCMTELYDALGADGLLMGSIGYNGEMFQLDVKVVSSRDGHVLSAVSRRANVAGMLYVIDDASAQVAAEVYRALRPGQHPLTPKPEDTDVVTAVEVKKEPPPKHHPLRPLGWAPVAAGTLLATVAGFQLLEAQQRYDHLTTPGSADLPEAVSTYTAGAKDYQARGWGLMAGGLVCVAAGVALFLWLDQPPVRPSVALLPGGGWSVALSGAWP